VEVRIQPPAPGSPKQTIGVELGRETLSAVKVRPTDPLDAVAKASAQTVDISGKIFNALTSALTAAALSALGIAPAGTAPALEGPVGIVGSAVDLAGKDPQLFYGFVATISLNVAVFNTLPFPGLDGGQMALLGVDALAATLGLPRLDERVKDGINTAAALALSGLALSILFNDIAKALPGS